MTEAASRGGGPRVEAYRHPTRRRVRRGCEAARRFRTAGWSVVPARPRGGAPASFLGRTLSDRSGGAYHSSQARCHTEPVAMLKLTRRPNGLARLHPCVTVAVVLVALGAFPPPAPPCRAEGDTPRVDADFP